MAVVVTVKDIQDFFGVGKRAAQYRLHGIRKKLGKKTGESGKGGADPVTWDELYAHYNIKKP